MINKKAILTFFLVTITANPVQAAGNPSLGTINALSINPADPGSMLAATNEGVWSFNQGNWKEFTSPKGEITDLANAMVGHDILYMVSRDGILYKSTNQGNDYSPLEVNVHGESFNVRTVSTHPANADLVMVGTNNGFLIQSNDGGTSWKIINDDFPFTALNSIAIDPENSNTIYIGTGGNGVLKTTDSGNTWNRMNNGLEDLTITRIIGHPDDHSILFAGTYGGGVYLSENGGESWTEINNGLEDTFVYSMALTPTKSSTNPDIYVGVFGGDLYRSTISENINWEKL